MAAEEPWGAGGRPILPRVTARKGKGQTLQRKARAWDSPSGHTLPLPPPTLAFPKLEAQAAVHVG